MPTLTYVALANTTLSSAASQITFGSIPGTYKDLVMVIALTGLSGTPTASGGYMRVNSSSSGYSDVSVYGNNSIGSDLAGTQQTFYPFNNNPGIYRTNFLDYSATNKHKTMLTRIDVPAAFNGMIAHRWENTSAITSITLFSPDNGSDTFNSGSTFTLYGIAG